MTTEPAINVENVVRHWTNSSDNDYQTMLVLLEAKQNVWALFIGHLVLEKLLKAYYVRQKQCQAPLIHDLARIAERTGLTLTQEQTDCLFEITGFNINARYDDYKRNFYALCTAEYTAKWSEIIKELRLWIKQQL